MTLHEHIHDGHAFPLAPPMPPTPADLRGNAERLLARGADAIERALSQDNAAFLAASRQEGGE